VTIIILFRLCKCVTTGTGFVCGLTKTTINFYDSAAGCEGIVCSDRLSFRPSVCLSVGMVAQLQPGAFSCCSFIYFILLLPVCSFSFCGCGRCLQSVIWRTSRESTRHQLHFFYSLYCSLCMQ